MRILIVDDEAPTRRLLQRQLLASPLVSQVVQAASAEEGAALAEAQEFDVLLVDLVLGIQDGRELLAPLRLAAAPSATLVVLTSLPAEEAEASAMAAGADLFMQKETGLYRALAERLDAARSRRTS